MQSDIFSWGIASLILLKAWKTDRSGDDVVIPADSNGGQSTSSAIYTCTGSVTSSGSTMSTVLTSPPTRSNTAEV